MRLNQLCMSNKLNLMIVKHIGPKYGCFIRPLLPLTWRNRSMAIFRSVYGPYISFIYQIKGLNDLDPTVYVQ